MKINRVYFNAHPTQRPPLLGGLFEAILAVFPLPNRGRAGLGGF